MNLRGNLSVGQYILNDYTLQVSLIEDGYRITITKGSDVQTIDLLSLSEVEISKIRLHESIRKESERERVAAEEARNQNEQQRISAELTRGSSEEGRQDAEGARAEAESLRALAESERSRNEANRESAETLRDEAEAERSDAEDARAEAESSRVSAETGRATAESSRVSAEALRAAAETDRASDWSGLRSDVLSATNAANLIASRLQLLHFTLNSDLTLEVTF